MVICLTVKDLDNSCIKIRLWWLIIWSENIMTREVPPPLLYLQECGSHTVQSPPSLERLRRAGAVRRMTQGIWVENLCACVLVWGGWCGRLTHQKSGLCLWRQLSCPHPSTIAAFLFQSQDISSPLLSSWSFLTPAAHSAPQQFNLHLTDLASLLFSRVFTI